MKALTYTDAQENLEGTMDQVCKDRSPVIVTRESNPSVVIISLEDYESLEETAYLFRSPANAERLHRAMDSLDKGEGQERKINLES